MIKSILNKCWFKHNFKVVSDNGFHVYKQCSRCGGREVTIVKLGKCGPNYDWVYKRTDDL